MESIYFHSGFIAFWLAASFVGLLALAVIGGMGWTVVQAWRGAKDWIAIKAVDQFTGMTEDERNACFRDFTDSVYETGGFSADDGNRAIKIVRLAIERRKRRKESP